MYRNKYANMAASDVPLYQMSKEDVEKLRSQTLSPFKSEHLMSKVDSLEKEVSSLKTFNAELRDSVELLNKKLDTQATTTANVLLQQQQMLSAMMQHMGLQLPLSQPPSSSKPKAPSKTPVFDNKPKGEKKVDLRPKEKGIKITEDGQPMSLRSRTPQVQGKGKKKSQ